MEIFTLFCAVLVVLAIWWVMKKPRTARVSGYGRPQVQQLTPYSSYKIIQTPSELNWLINHLSTQEAIGVDIEHCAKNYKGQICLLQISTSQDFIVDTLALQDHMLTFKAVFESDRPLKVMHGAHNDVKWLLLSYGIKVRSLYDTQEAVKLTGSSDLGLDKLWEKYCGFGMGRSEKKAMQKSDWSLRPLSGKQLEYAATDSHYLLYLQQATWLELDGRQRTLLFERCQQITEKAGTPSNHRQLEKYQSGMDPETFQTFISLLELREREAKTQDTNPRNLVPSKVLAELAATRPSTLKEYSYRLFETQSQAVLAILRTPIEPSLKQKKPTREEVKRRRFEQFVEKFSIKKVIYDHCQIQAPDGELLSYCDKRKANWYLEKELATIANEDPLVIRLKFEPKGRISTDIACGKTFCLKEKHNLCVVCGSTGMFQRYHIVPLLYRQLYTQMLHSQVVHEVILLCPKCHEKANRAADKMIRDLSQEYGVPLAIYSDLYVSRQQLEVACKKAKSLMSESIPSERKNLILLDIKRYFEQETQYSSYMSAKFGEDWLNDQSAVTYLGNNMTEILQVHGPVNWKKESMNLHGKQLLAQIPDIYAFFSRWRKNFIEEMKPKYLTDL